MWTGPKPRYQSLIEHMELNKGVAAVSPVIYNLENKENTIRRRFVCCMSREISNTGNFQNNTMMITLFSGHRSVNT